MAKKYQFPLNFERLLSGKKLPTIDVEQSIHNHIYILLMTRLGQHRFNPNYGCEMWNYEFVIEGVDDQSWKSEMEERLEQTISKFEPRISDKLRLSIKVSEDKTKLDNGIENITKELKITVSNIKLKHTDEQLSDFESTVVFSPITLD